VEWKRRLAFPAVWLNGQAVPNGEARHFQLRVLITFDEDAQDGQHPGRSGTPTIIVDSAGVRPGYVSPVRYTITGLLRRSRPRSAWAR